MMIFWSKYKSIFRKRLFFLRKLFNQFEKSRATRACMDGVGSVLVWVLYLRGKRASMVDLDGVADAPV